MLQDLASNLFRLPAQWLSRVMRPAKGHAVDPKAKEQVEHVLLRERIVTRLQGISESRLFLPIQETYTDETSEMRAVYRKMLRDPTVKAAVWTKLLAVCHLDPQVQPASDRPIDKDAADFIRHALRKAKGGVRGIVQSILFPALLEGYSVSEKVWMHERKGRWAGKIRLKALKSKDVENLDLLTDEYRNVVSLRDRYTNEEYDPSQFVIYTHMPLYESPTGTSDMRAAYRAYWLIDTAWKLRAIGLERFSLPLLKGQYSNDAEKAELESQLPLVRGQSWLTVPTDCQVEAMDLAARGTADFEAAIRDLREDIAIGITGAVLQMLQGQVSDGRGSSDVHRSTSELLQWMLAAEGGDVISTQLVPDLTDMNFEDADYAEVTLGGVNDQAMAASLTIDQGLLGMGIELSKEEMYRRYGREKPVDETDKLISPMAGGGMGMMGGGMMGGMGGIPPADPSMGGGMFADQAPDDSAQKKAQADLVTATVLKIQKSLQKGEITRGMARGLAKAAIPDLDDAHLDAMFPDEMARAAENPVDTQVEEEALQSPILENPPADPEEVEEFGEDEGGLFEEFNWVQQKARTGNLKAVWDVEGEKRKPLYGEAARRALARQRETSRGGDATNKAMAKAPAVAQPESQALQKDGPWDGNVAPYRPKVTKRDYDKLVKGPGGDTNWKHRGGSQLRDQAVETGYVTNGRILLKATPPEIEAVRAGKNFNQEDAVRGVKSVQGILSDAAKSSPAVFKAARSLEMHPAYLFESQDGKKLAVDARLAEMVMKRFPDAKPFNSTHLGSKVFFKRGDEIVGVVVGLHESVVDGGDQQPDKIKAAKPAKEKAAKRKPKSPDAAAIRMTWALEPLTVDFQAIRDNPKAASYQQIRDFMTRLSHRSGEEVSEFARRAGFAVNKSDSKAKVLGIVSNHLQNVKQALEGASFDMTKPAGEPAEQPKAKEPWEMTQSDAVRNAGEERKRTYTKYPYAVYDRETGQVVAEITADKVPYLNTAKYEAKPIGSGTPDDPMKDTGWVSNVKRRHFAMVSDALASGKTVPPEVLADYPDLAEKFPGIGGSDNAATRMGRKVGAETAKAKEPWEMTRGSAEKTDLTADLTGRVRAIKLPDWASKDAWDSMRESQAAWQAGNPQKARRLHEETIGILRQDKSEFLQNHRSAVESALQSGKPVPPEVLADYPELAKKYAKHLSEPVTNFADATLLDIPDIRQERDNDCGPACVAAIMGFHGHEVPPLADLVGELNTSDSGTSPKSIGAFFDSIGLKPEAGDDLPLEDLERHTSEGRPVLALIQRVREGQPAVGHYVVVRGLDDTGVHLHDPIDGQIALTRRAFLHRWHDRGNDGKRYVRFGMAVHPEEPGDGPEQFDDDQPTEGPPEVAPPTPQPDQGLDIAGTMADQEKAQQLLNRAELEGIATLASVSRRAVGRLLNEKGMEGALNATELFSPLELMEVQEALARVNATANLLGRQRILVQKDRSLDEEGREVTTFAADEPTLHKFAEPIQPLSPEAAVAYFKGLRTDLGIRAPIFGEAMRRQAFTLAATTSQTLLDRVKKVIQDWLSTGRQFPAATPDDPTGGATTIENILTDAGVHPANPQYSEMVFRTNAMDAYNKGAWDQMREVADVFPVWQYLGIADGRQGEDHAPQFGKWYSNEHTFDEVRGPRPFNCRCTWKAVSRYRWKKLQAQGATVSEPPTWDWSKYKTMSESTGGWFAESKPVRHFRDNPARYFINWNGLRIGVEVPKGEIRRGHGWQRRMELADYGRIVGTTGFDGDQVDVFIGPDLKSPLVLVIDQLDENGAFDEKKAVIGFRTEAEAERAYLANYPDGWKRYSGYSKMNVRDFKRSLGLHEPMVVFSDAPPAEPKKRKETEHIERDSRGFPTKIVREIEES